MRPHDHMLSLLAVAFMSAHAQQSKKFTEPGGNDDYTSRGYHWYRCFESCDRYAVPCSVVRGSCTHRQSGGIRWQCDLCRDQKSGGARFLTERCSRSAEAGQLRW